MCAEPHSVTHRLDYTLCGTAHVHPKGLKASEWCELHSSRADRSWPAGAAGKAWNAQHKAPPLNLQLDCTLVNLSLPVMLLAGQILQLPIHKEGS